MQTANTYNLVITTVIKNKIVQQQLFLNVNAAEIKNEIELISDTFVTNKTVHNIIKNAGECTNVIATCSKPVTVQKYLQCTAFK